MKAFIIFKDRVTYGQRCVLSMIRSGLEPVVVDQGSTWPQALDWLDDMEQDGFTVLHRGKGHPRDLGYWDPFIDACGDQRYIVTDPDVVPSDICPRDWPGRLSLLLDDHPEIVKAALGLRIDNLPDHYGRKEQVIKWEEQFWKEQIEAGVYSAPVDTTLAMYRERSTFVMQPGARMGHPYVADHLAWHENFDDLPQEIRYYYEHAEPGIAHWAARGYSAWGN